MVEKILRAKNLEMARGIIQSLRDRGEISSRAEAIEKLSDREWLAERRYLHVAEVLVSDIGKEAINDVFDDANSF